MFNPSRRPFFARLAELGTHRPLRVLLVTFAIVVACATAIPGLGVSTSRYGLVTEDDPVQNRLVQFFENFGYPDSPVIVVEGGTAEDRRRVVDDLITGLNQLPELEERILARVGPREVAEVILLQRPEMLTPFVNTLADGTSPADAIERGLPAIVQSIQTQLNTFAVTLQVQAFSPMGRTVTPEQAEQVLEGLTRLASAAAASLAGENKWNELIAANSNESLKWSGLDEKGYIAGTEGNFHIVALFPELANDEVKDLQPLVEKVRQVRDEVLARHGAAGIAANVTGIPTLAVDEMDVLSEGVRTSSLATAVLVLVFFLLAFRSARQAMLAAAPLLTGIVVALAAARVFFGELNLVTSTCMSVLMGLGIDFAVYTLARYNEERRIDDEPVGAIKRAITHSGPAIATGAVTTALSFLTTMTTDFTAFAELGVLTAIGLGVTLMAAFLVIPPLIASSRFFHARAAPEVPGLHLVPRIVSRAPWLLAGGGVALTVAGALLLGRLDFNSRYFDFLPEHTESVMALQHLERDMGMSPIFAVLTANSMKEARQIAAKLRTLPEVGGVQSPTDLVPEMNEDLLGSLRSLSSTRRPDFQKLANYPTKAEELVPSLNGIIDAIDRIGFSLQLSGRDSDRAQEAAAAVKDFRKKLEELPGQGTEVLLPLQERLAEVGVRAWDTAVTVANRGHYSPHDLPKIMQIRFASLDRQQVAVYAYPAGNPWDSEFAAHFTETLEAIDPNVTGFLVTTAHHIKIIIGGFQRAAGIAGVFVFMVLLWNFRRLPDVALAAMPLLMGWLWMLGIMSVAEIPFNVANMVALPLVLGIGIDAGVHIVHRTRESAEANGGVGRLDDLLRGTGGAVVISALTTIAGFAGLMVTDYGAMTSLGITMVIGVSTCALASLFVLPAVLVLLGRAK